MNEQPGESVDGGEDRGGLGKRSRDGNATSKPAASHTTGPAPSDAVPSGGGKDDDSSSDDDGFGPAIPVAKKKKGKLGALILACYGTMVHQCFRVLMSVVDMVICECDSVGS